MGLCRVAVVVVALATVAVPASLEAGEASCARFTSAGPDESTIARVVTTTRARRSPGDAMSFATLTPTTPWGGGATWLLVRGCAVGPDGRPWVRVLLPQRPNGSTGWVRGDLLLVRRTPYRIDISTTRRTVVVRRDGQVVKRFRAVVGAPATPTPRGSFAVVEAVPQPAPKGFLGPWVVHLTAHSNVLENFGGGPGRVGIHGRDGSSLRDPLGSARSHGCIRVDDAAVTWIATHVPAGAPVAIR